MLKKYKIIKIFFTFINIEPEKWSLAGSEEDL